MYEKHDPRPVPALQCPGDVARLKPEGRPSSSCQGDDDQAQPEDESCDVGLGCGWVVGEVIALRHKDPDVSAGRDDRKDECQGLKRRIRSSRRRMSTCESVSAAADDRTSTLGLCGFIADSSNDSEV